MVVHHANDGVLTVFGLFDGTVGDMASEFMHQNVAAIVLANENIKSVLARMNISKAAVDEEELQLLESGLRASFLNLDAAFLSSKICQENEYSSCTGVIGLLWKNVLTIGHIGDSRACLGSVDEQGSPYAEWLTFDHKPNQTKEKERIVGESYRTLFTEYRFFQMENFVASGGQVVYLHGDKPFLRGGDFFQRHSLGHHPKQLNYSRAFGGKGLKKYGLIAGRLVPDSMTPIMFKYLWCRP